jgi:succinate-semialdehyde dehydrogenase/glutarate-semialdehyde dehydrogenase
LVTMALLQRLVAPSARGALRQSPAITLMITRKVSNASPPKLKDPSLLKQDVCYVNGEWVKAKSGKNIHHYISDYQQSINRIFSSID